MKGKIAGRLAIGGTPALANAGASANPLIRRIDLGGQLVVGDNALRQITAGSDDACVFQDDPLSSQSFDARKQQAARCRAASIRRMNQDGASDTRDQSSSTTGPLVSITLRPR